MAEQLDTIVLVANCPAKSKILSIFGNRCAYMNARCAIPNSYPLTKCELYGQHNKPRSANEEPDAHETHLGVGACDINLAERIYNG